MKKNCIGIAALAFFMTLSACASPSTGNQVVEEEEKETEVIAEEVQIETSPDKYTWYVQNYVGKNLANIGYTSLGGDRRDTYGAGNIELVICSDDGTYIDIEDEDSLKQYVVVEQNYEPNTEIKYTFEVDSEGEEYENLVDWKNIEKIDLLVKKVGSELSKNVPKLVSTKVSPDKYNHYVRNYVGKNLANIGYTSLGGDRRDEYGHGSIKFVLSSNDGSFIDVEDKESLKQYVVVSQDVSPDTQITYTYSKDEEGKEYSSLVHTQNIDKINLTLKKNNTENTKKQTKKEEKQDKKEKSTNKGIDPDLKDFLDSYEAFMDEYVEFMKEYKENPSDLSLITEYADMMQEYAEFAEECEDYDQDEMSPADLAYYLEVTARIQNKLASVL